MKFTDMKRALSVAWKAAKQDSDERIKIYLDEAKKLILTPENSEDIKQKLSEYQTFLKNTILSAEDFDRLMYICEEFLIFQKTLEDTTKHKSFINEVLPRLSELNDVGIAYPLTMKDDEFEFYKTDENGTWLINKRMPSVLKYINDNKKVTYFYRDGITLQERYDIVEERGGHYSLDDRYFRYEYYSDHIPWWNIKDYWNNNNKEVFTVKEDGTIGSANILPIIKSLKTFSPINRYVIPCYSVQLIDEDIEVPLVDVQELNIKHYDVTKYSDEKTEQMLEDRIKIKENIDVLKEVARRIRESNPAKKVQE